MNAYVNDETYKKVMDIEFKKKLYNINDEAILSKIGFSDVVDMMYETLKGKE